MKAGPSVSSGKVQQARLLLIGTTLLWGLSFPLLRGLQLAQSAAVPHVSTSALASADVALRFGFAALMLLPFCARHLGRITSREWSQSLGLALLGGVGLFLQTIGLAWTDASITAFLTQLYTLIVPLIVAWRDRRWPSRRIIASCVLVLLGAAILSPGLLTRFTLGWGEMVIILSTGFLAATIVWVERPVYAANRPGVVTLLMFSFLAGLEAVLFFFLGGTALLGGQLLAPPGVLLLMLALALLCTVCTFFVMNAWQRFIPATEAGLIYCLEPVIATLLCAAVPGWISHFAAVNYPNEALHPSLFLGGGLIIAATLLAATEPAAPNSTSSAAFVQSNSS